MHAHSLECAPTLICIDDSLADNGIGVDGAAAVADELDHVRKLQTLEYVCLCRTAHVRRERVVVEECQVVGECWNCEGLLSTRQCCERR